MTDPQQKTVLVTFYAKDGAHIESVDVPYPEDAVFVTVGYHVDPPEHWLSNAYVDDSPIETLRTWFKPESSEAEVRDGRADRSRRHERRTP